MIPFDDVIMNVHFYEVGEAFPRKGNFVIYFSVFASLSRTDVILHES